MAFSIKGLFYLNFALVALNILTIRQTLIMKSFKTISSGYCKHIE